MGGCQDAVLVIIVVRKDYEKAIEVLRRVLSEEPTRVEANAQLMRLYALSGRQLEALGHYGRLETTLSETFGTKPDAQTRRLRDEIASGRFPPPAPTHQEEPALEEHAGANIRHNLPLQRTTFVGREREMVEVKRALSMTGLLTLTGAGGSGKTRLALEVARELVSVYPDGVWLAELAPLSDLDLVAGQVARALSIQEQPDRPLVDTLTATLRDKKALLVLDNCEHLVDAAADLAGVLLSSCPRLKILATSREPLGVVGEVNWRVSPLAVPAVDHLPDAENLARYESVRLFVDRARSRLPTFELVRENTAAVARVCRKLDGIHLAIELATARMGALAVEQVAERLEDSLGLLSSGSRTTEPRQQTLRATLDWSYEPLSDPEKRLFARLSVFAGGFTLEAVEAVGAGDGIEEDAVLESFLLLVDKSLVVAEPDGEGRLRYGMLEPVRQYAREILAERGEAEAVRRRHAQYYLSLGERAEPELGGADQVEWLTRLETEHDNLRTALMWALEQNEIELGLRLAGTVCRFWYTRGHLKERRRWLDSLLAKDEDGPASVRAKALIQAGVMANGLGYAGRAKEVYLEALELYRAIGDEAGTALALFVLGTGTHIPDDAGEARALFGEALELFRRLGNDDLAALTLHYLGEIALAEGDQVLARRLYEESLTLFRKMGGTWGSAWCLCGLGHTALYGGDHNLAKSLFTEALTLARAVGEKVLVALLLEGLAGAATARARTERAARLWGAAEVLRKEVGAPMESHELAAYERAMDEARTQLDERAFAAAWEEGRSMTLEEAIDYALTDEPATAPRSEPSNLTRREREVATFVARGLTNRRIASELGIAERTVTTHVGRILKKLRLESRAQLAVWVAEQGLLR
jgi:predicted ATPase/DNA-binding CsgD family transcriptional regulator